MKKLLTFLACNVAAFSLSAQVTIDYPAYATWTPATQSFQNVTPFQLTPSANATWDLSTQTYGALITIPYMPFTDPALPQVSYKIPSTYSFSAFSYMSDICYGINAQGVQRFGEKIARQAFGLGAVTANPQDSLVFTTQTINYSSPRTMLAFPAMAGSNWPSDYQFNTNFLLTVSMYALNQTPGYRKSHFTQTDTVKGWGKMRVKDLTGKTSAYINVLAVKTHYMVVDSFFLGGSPAPAALLTAFGISQGMTNHYYKISYYRAGEVESLLQLSYSDATYTTVSGASTHADRLPSGLGIAGIEFEEAVTVYPNPVTGGHINLSIANSGRNSSWSYELMNSVGQVVASDKLTLSGATTTINTSRNAPGIYFMKVYQEGKLQTVKQVVIQ